MLNFCSELKLGLLLKKYRFLEQNLCAQVKTQLLEYDYSKKPEDGTESSMEATESLGSLTPPPSLLDQSTTAVPPVYDEYVTTSPPNDDPYVTTTSSYIGYETTTTVAVDNDYPVDGSHLSYTVDGLDTNSAFIEPVHDATEDEMTTGWGWFGTTAEPTVVPSTKKSKKTRRRKKQRRRRGRKGKKRVGSIPPLV